MIAKIYIIYYINTIVLISVAHFSMCITYSLLWLQTVHYVCKGGKNEVRTSLTQSTTPVKLGKSYS